MDLKAADRPVRDQISIQPKDGWVCKCQGCTKARKHERQNPKITWWKEK